MKWDNFLFILLLALALSGIHTLGKVEGRKEARRTMDAYVTGAVDLYLSEHKNTACSPATP